jgi:hypothetical protein
MTDNSEARCHLMQKRVKQVNQGRMSFDGEQSLQVVMEDRANSKHKLVQ